MLGTGPRGKIGATLSDELERQGRADSMDLRQVYTQHTVECGPDLKVRRVHLPLFGPDFGKVTDIVPLAALQCLERGLQLPVAFENLGLVKVI